MTPNPPEGQADAKTVAEIEELIEAGHKLHDHAINLIEALDGIRTEAKTVRRLAVELKHLTPKARR